jgi:hypothetical protein
MTVKMTLEELSLLVDLERFDVTTEQAHHRAVRGLIARGMAQKVEKDLTITEKGKRFLSDSEAPAPSIRPVSER